MTLLARHWFTEHDKGGVNLDQEGSKEELVTEEGYTLSPNIEAMPHSEDKPKQQRETGVESQNIVFGRNPKGGEAPSEEANRVVVLVLPTELPQRFPDLVRSFEGTPFQVLPNGSVYRGGVAQEQHLVHLLPEANSAFIPFVDWGGARVPRVDMGEPLFEATVGADVAVTSFDESVLHTHRCS